MIGTDILRVLKEEQLDSKIIMISAVGQDSVIQEGMRLGAAAYVVKPFTTESLLEVIDQHMKDE